MSEEKTDCNITPPQYVIEKVVQKSLNRNNINFTYHEIIH